MIDPTQSEHMSSNCYPLDRPAREPDASRFDKSSSAEQQLVDLRSAAILRLASESDCNLLLIMPKVDFGIISQPVNEVFLFPGEAILVSTDGPTSTSARIASRSLIVGLQRQRLEPHAPDLDETFMSPIPANTLALRLLSHYVESLRGLQALAEPSLLSIAASHVHDLVALMVVTACRAYAIVNGEGVRSRRLDAIKADIVKNIQQPDLSVAAVALRHAVTSRHVQKLFAADGTTFTEFVLGNRLPMARRALTNPNLIDKNISTIAFEVGFNDVSYFNRSFRRLYGMSPSKLRALSRGEPTLAGA